MQTTFPEVRALTLIISTSLILLFAITTICILYINQRKRYRHQEEVLKMKEEFNKALFQSSLEIQEHTLDHIAKELHANICHLVSLININLAEIIKQNPAEPNENILETKSLTKQLLSEMKALSASLNTDHIRNIGFRKAIENELGRISKATKSIINFTVSGEEKKLCPEHEIILFRLCQEVLNNVVKYAKANKVTVTIEHMTDQMKVSIMDNGIGFDVNLAKQKSAERESTGLINIEKRARLIDADFNIISKAGEGTRIDICIPNKMKNESSKHAKS
jgi:signal transduction histidine kinase